MFVSNLRKKKQDAMSIIELAIMKIGLAIRRNW
jgi:hypothetical protein